MPSVSSVILLALNSLYYISWPFPIVFSPSFPGHSLFFFIFLRIHKFSIMSGTQSPSTSVSIGSHSLRSTASAKAHVANDPSSRDGGDSSSSVSSVSLIDFSLLVFVLLPLWYLCYEWLF